MINNCDDISDLESSYPDLNTAISKVSKQWCNETGYSEPFYHNGEMWAFPPDGVIPVKIKDVITQKDCKKVWIGRVSLFILPDGSLVKGR
ncbi:MAG: hypothetical protein ACFB02_08120 [Mastigocoleus sp.]